MSIRLVEELIDHQAMVESMRHSSNGAVVLFLGAVRDMTDGRRVKSLEYEAQGSMATAKLLDVVRRAEAKWPSIQAIVTHRVGKLELGDVAVAVVTAAPHRNEAFESAAWIMDEIKRVVPIWKKENWSDGDSDWVHPTPANTDS